VATSVEAVRSDVQNLRLDVSDSKNAIDKPGGILAQGLQNADLSRKIITSIEELGNAFSLRHDLGLVNATALSAQLDMLDRLHSSVATEEREMEEEAISPEDEIEGHVSDISETIAGQENGCTSLRLNETDMELLEKFRKALQESVDGLEQIQAHKAAVGEDFTNTAVKETQLSQLRQLAMFLASSFVAGLAAAMAAKDWDRPSRVVDWRKEWVQVYWHEERAQVNWHKERTQADHAIIDQKNPSAATVSPDYQDATPPVVRSLRQPKVHVQQKLESIPPSLWECCHCTHWSSSVVRPTSCENPKCRHYTASCRTCLERNKVRLNLSSYDRRLDGSDWNGHGHGYSHAELSGVFDDVWEQSTEKDDDDADAHGSKNDLKQDDGDKDSKNSEDRPISDSDKKDGMGGYKKQGDNQERPRPPFSSKLEYAIMS
jgi:hypothetical protein